MDIKRSLSIPDIFNWYKRCHYGVFINHLGSCLYPRNIDCCESELKSFEGPINDIGFSNTILYDVPYDGNNGLSNDKTAYGAMKNIMPPGFLPDSEYYCDIYLKAYEYARDNKIIFICGPSGSGKLTLANFIHKHFNGDENKGRIEIINPGYDEDFDAIQYNSKNALFIKNTIIIKSAENALGPLQREIVKIWDKALDNQISSNYNIIVLMKKIPEYIKDRKDPVAFIQLLTFERFFSNYYKDNFVPANIVQLFQNSFNDDRYKKYSVDEFDWREEEKHSEYIARLTTDLLQTTNNLESWKCEWKNNYKDLIEYFKNAKWDLISSHNVISEEDTHTPYLLKNQHREILEDTTLYKKNYPLYNIFIDSETDGKRYKVSYELLCKELNRKNKQGKKPKLYGISKEDLIHKYKEYCYKNKLPLK